MTIDLKNYSTPGAIFLSGRPKGEGIRSEIGLDSVDTTEDFTVEIPDSIISLNSSFFLGLFGPSVRKLGPDEFRRRFLFHGPSAIYRDIDDGIRQALKDSNPLKV